MSQQERNKRYREKMRKVVHEAKDVPCADCGGSFPHYVMEFDHLGDKLDNVGALAGCSGLAVIQAEIAKCDAVCANCHKIRTHKRKQVSVLSRVNGSPSALEAGVARPCTFESCSADQSLTVAGNQSINAMQ